MTKSSVLQVALQFHSTFIMKGKAKFQLEVSENKDTAFGYFHSNHDTDFVFMDTWKLCGPQVRTPVLEDL